jgi:hypothetical protein
VLAIFKVANKRPAYWWRHQVIELTTSYALSQSAQCADRWLAHGNWAASATKPAAAPSSTIRCALLYALQTCLPRPISVISCFCPHQWCVQSSWHRWQTGNHWCRTSILQQEYLYWKSRRRLFGPISLPCAVMLLHFAIVATHSVRRRTCW